MINSQMKDDLVMLVADKNMEFAVKGLLSRPKSLNIREITCKIYVHPEKDPGCLLRGHEFLRSFTKKYWHAIVMFDRYGCGQEAKRREILEKEIEERLSQSGWDNRASAIIIDPELEIWVWSDSPHVDSVLGWTEKIYDLRKWLRSQGLLHGNSIKPSAPKKAMAEALRSVNKPRSSSLYLQLALKVSIDRCVDEAFLKFKKTLQNWFPK